MLFDSTYKLDGGQKPKQIDMIGTEGEAGERPLKEFTPLTATR